jgi:hypothetical protein
LTLLVASAGAACAHCADSAITAAAPAASCAILIAPLPRCTLCRNRCPRWFEADPGHFNSIRGKIPAQRIARLRLLRTGKFSRAQSLQIESIGALTFWWRMIFSENRFPLFRIMR